MQDRAPFNFSKVSSRDAIAFGGSRPGFPSKQVSTAEISAWCTFMKGQGIKRVLSLLGDDEKTEFYPGVDIDAAMTAEFGQQNYTRTSVFKPESRQLMSTALLAAKEANEAIVIHCSGGEGRAALGMGLWLVDVYGLAPEDAMHDIGAERDRTPGVKRKLNAAKLSHLVTHGTMTGF